MARWRGRRRAGGSMGNDTPLACCPTSREPLRLLPPALRPGDQPADRPHPRGDGHEPRLLRGGRGEHPEGRSRARARHRVDAARPHQRGPRAAALVDRQHFQAKTLSLCFKAESGRMQRALDRCGARRGVRRGRLRGPDLSDRPVDSTRRDPLAPGRLRRAPPPHPEGPALACASSWRPARRASAPLRLPARLRCSAINPTSPSTRSRTCAAGRRCPSG